MTSPRPTYTARIGYSEVDRMGFLHHARHVVHLENARTELLRLAGSSYAEWEENGLLLPLTGLHVEYKHPGLYDDEIGIFVIIAELTRLRLSFHYEVFALGRGQLLLATARSEHVFMNKDGRPIRAPRERLAMLEAYAGCPS